MVTPSSTAVEVTKDRAYVFRTCFTNTQQGDAAARYAHDDLKKTTAASSTSRRTTTRPASRRRSATRSPGSAARSLLEKGYQKGETNFTTYLSELKATNAGHHLRARLLQRHGADRAAGEAARAHRADVPRRRRLGLGRPPRGRWRGARRGALHRSLRARRAVAELAGVRRPPSAPSSGTTRGASRRRGTTRRACSSTRSVARDDRHRARRSRTRSPRPRTSPARPGRSRSTPSTTRSSRSSSSQIKGKKFTYATQILAAVGKRA